MATIFVYILILDIAVLAVSFFKKWSALTIIALLGSIMNYMAWADAYYRSELLGPSLVFVTILFFVFLIASIARAVITKSTTDILNYLIIAINTVFFGSVVYGMLRQNHDDIMGFVAVIVAIIFMIVAGIINKFNPEDRAMNIFLPGLAVTFLSIAVPLQLSGPWVAVAWLVESVFLYVIASFIGNRGFQVMGVVVYALGLINAFFWNYPSGYSQSFTPIFNAHFIIITLSIVCGYLIAYMYHRYGSTTVEIQKRGVMIFVIIANILTIYAVSSQIIFIHQASQRVLSENYNAKVDELQKYNTNYYSSDSYRNLNSEFNQTRISIQNRSNTYVSIFWAIYAAILTAVGFGFHMKAARRLGLVLFLITAVKVVMDVWSLGQLYRIVSFTVFGIIALIASFAYAKNKDKLKEIV